MLVALTASLSALVFAGTPISQSELPKAAQTFLSKHFPGDNVKKPKRNRVVVVQNTKWILSAVLKLIFAITATGKK